MAVPEVFVDLDSVVFIQEDGPCTGYLPMTCHAIDSTSIGRTEATRVYCKSPSRRGERAVARTVPGRKEPGTLTINAWSQQQSDLLHRIWQKNCMFGAQTHLDVCGLPTDLTAYSKILDYYGIVPGSLDYSNIDNLEGGEGTGLQVALSCTYDDLIEVMKVALARVSRDPTIPGGITDVGDMRTISGDLRDLCGPNACGAPQSRCDVLVAFTGLAPPTCWYSTDNGATWTTTAVLPLAATALVNPISSSCVIGDRWIGFPTSPTAGYGGLCVYTEDSGATWTLVDMGGTAADDYVVSCYLHDASNLWACGGSGVAPSGHVWFSDDQGDSWTMFEDIETQILNDIATADGNTIYTVGDLDVMRKSENAGATWTQVTGPITGAFNSMAVRALTNDHVLVGGQLDTDSEQLWCSLDGGATWTAQIFEGSTTATTYVASISLAPNAPMQHAWMIQTNGASTPGTVFRSLDGGHNWEPWSLDNDGLRRIFACSSNHAWIAGVGDAAQGGTATVIHADPVS